MKVNVSLDYVNYKRKPWKKKVYEISDRVAANPVQIELLELAELVGSRGHTFAPAVFANNERTEDSFLEMQLIGLDFDKGIPYEAIKEKAERLGIPICFSYKTFNSKENYPKYRIVFMHECPIRDCKVAKVVIGMLLKIFKEADPSCSDTARMFFGGKGLIDSVRYETFNIVDLCQIYQKYVYMKSSKNYTRDIQSFASTHNLCCINDMLQISNAYEDGNKNEGETDSDPYNIVSSVIFPSEAPKFRISFGYQSNMRLKYEKPSPVRVYDNEMEEKCQLWSDFVHQYHIHHNLRFMLLTNIIHIVGGVKEFMKIIRSKYSSASEWEYYKKYIEAKNYKPMDCSNCPYSDECKHKRNLVLTLKAKDKIKKLDIEEIYYPVDEVYEYVCGAMNEVLLNPTHRGIFIIPAQTSLGKTEAYCRLVEKEKDKKFIISVPTIELKRKIVGRLENLGVNAVMTVSIEELGLPDDILWEIKNLYGLGLGKNVRNVLKKLIKEASTGERKVSDYTVGMCQLYLKNFEYFGKERVIVTTHARLKTLTEDCMSGYNTIIDEDILSTYFKNTRCVKVEDIENVLRSGYCATNVYERLNKVANMRDREYIKLKDVNILGEITEEQLAEINVCGNVNELLVASTCYREQDTIYYFCRTSLPNGKYIVLSATADASLYRRYFKGFPIMEYEYRRAKYEGRVKQYTALSMSRQCIADNKEKLVQYLEQYRDTHHLITFMKYEKELNATSLHFGNSEGIDDYKGKNILVLGTPHLCEFIYKLIALSIGINIENETLAVRRIRYKSYEFSIMTYENEELRNLQLYFINKEIEQCVGRARLLRNDCEVLVFSNFPVEQAELIQDEYLAME